MKQQDIENFLRGRFELDCPKIELIPCDLDSKKVKLSGSGYISLNEDGHFDLKVYFPEAFSINEVFEKLNWEAGKVIGNEFYYDLIARDMSGNTWRAERFIPDKNSGPNGSMIIGKIPELHQTENTNIDNNKQLIQLHFNEAIKVPLNTVVKEQETVGDKTRKLKTSIRLARFEASNIEFEVEENDGYTALSAVTEAFDLTDTVINRIFESFCFVTAHSGSWSILTIRRNGATETLIKAVKRKNIKSRIPSPISYQRIQDNDSVWQLFECYLNYTIENNSDRYHSLSTLIYSVIESGKASLDVEALTLSVSIESLLNDELSHLYSVIPDLIKNITSASELVKNSHELDDSFKNRVLGSLSAMKSARAKDILFELRDQGPVDRELVKTYGNIRNKTAHGARDTGADIQNYFNQISAVLVLFFQLVFLVIKYNGEYTDYGTYGYPTKIFESKLP